MGNTQYTEIDSDNNYVREAISVYKRDYDNLSEGDKVIFDIDGTLIAGLSPIDDVISFYHELLSRGCEIYIVTARPKEGRLLTEDQLYDLGITGYKKLHLYPYSKESKIYSILNYKKSTAHNIGNIKFSIGDNWHDIHSEYAPKYGLETETYVGNGFIKLPISFL